MKVFNKILLLSLVALLSTNLMAQKTYEDAVNLYNSAAEQASAKEYDKAIATYKEAAQIGEELGTPQGTDIKSRSEQQIPKVQLNKAGNLFNAFRSSKQIPDLDIAITAFEEAVEVGKEYEDTRVTQAAQGYVPQLYYQKATMLFKREMYTEADNALNSAIQANANYAQPYYTKGLVAKKLSDDINDALRWFDQAIAVADKTNKGQISRQAKTAAHDELLFRGSKLIESENYSDAIDLLKLATEYDAESSDVYYRLAEAYNKQSKFDLAISNAKTALTHEQGGKTDKAKIYFEMGYAYQMKGNKAEACSAYTDASFGSFKAPAEHSMEFELKCGTTN
jgi:tetratricopeptide (TPR) repeat protein